MPRTKTQPTEDAAVVVTVNGAPQVDDQPRDYSTQVAMPQAD